MFLFYTYSMSEIILRNGFPYKNELDKKLVKYCIFCQKICQVLHTQPVNLSVHFSKTYMESGKPKTDSAYGRAIRMVFFVHTYSGLCKIYHTFSIEKEKRRTKK